MPLAGGFETVTLPIGEVFPIHFGAAPPDDPERGAGKRWVGSRGCQGHMLPRGLLVRWHMNMLVLLGRAKCQGRDAPDQWISTRAPHPMINRVVDLEGLVLSRAANGL